jgi:putative membrane protein
MKHHLFIGAAALALAGCSSDLQTAGGQDTAPTAGAATSATTAPAFVAAAGASDLYEIQSSQLVLQGAQNADIRRFAQMMVSDHTMTTQQVTAAAQSAGLNPPPPQLDAAKRDMIQQLQSASGADRERLYARQQVMAHQEALALHSSYARDGDNAALKAVAQQAVPIIQRHLAEIQRISASAG